MRYLYRNYLRSLFFSGRFYWFFAALILLFLLSYSFSFFLEIARIALFVFGFLVVFDYVLLFSRKLGIKIKRTVPARFSNGDQNKVSVLVRNRYRFAIRISIIDELPVQLQIRNFQLDAVLKEQDGQVFTYNVRPVERGEYEFHDTHVFVRSPINFVIRRFTSESTDKVKVYPSYLLMRQFELLAYSNNLAEAGNKRIRKVGHSLEFEQIKDYVTGDDIRSINWKATARKGGQLMVNNYTDERSQQVYCVLDKGRVMKMPFEGMTLLDHAINAALVLSRVALIRQDKAGLITFSESIGQFVPADRKAGQMNQVLETLYHQQTMFGESDHEKLFNLIRTRVPQRSLIILFTNFESMSGLERQLPYLRALSKMHLLMVVFFENTELQELRQSKSRNVESLYIRTIAEKFVYEKKLIVKELNKHGITSILTPPEKLTVNTINKYLEIKARQAI
jgi:uncharacterized protein (DUF58 family)